MSTTTNSSSALDVIGPDENGVLVLRFNKPRKYNAWDAELISSVKDALTEGASDDAVKAVVITGKGKFYSSGVDFKNQMTLMLPSSMVAMATESNRVLFGTFINFPKPILAALNGPAIGAAATSATLCDAIIASPHATFLLPFTKLGLPAEGCSSFTFAHRYGEEFAHTALVVGDVITADAAHKVGMVNEIVAGGEDALLARAVHIAGEWAKEGRARPCIEDGQVSKLNQVNAEESTRLGKAIISTPFLQGQYKFAIEKNKTAAARAFCVAMWTRPLWSRL